jgi:IS5 family transposase
MKAHIGADEESGLVHTVISTAANVSDISQTAGLLHGQEERVGADAGYVGVEKRAEMKAKLEAIGHPVVFRIARRRAPIRKMADGWQKTMLFALGNLYLVRNKLCT